MEIVPIAALTSLPVSRYLPAVLDPSPMARLENSARAGDETYSSSADRQAQGSADCAGDDPDTDSATEELESEESNNFGSRNVEVAKDRAVSFFA